MTLDTFLELFEEPEVIAPEISDVIDAVSQHRDALGPHAKGETRVFLGIVVAIAEQGGVYHAGD